MASFVSANLSHEITGGFVKFTIEAKIHFEELEVGHRWLFQIELMEEDPTSVSTRWLATSSVKETSTSCLDGTM